MTVNVKLTEEQIAEIISQLTPEQRSRVEKEIALQNFLEATKDVHTDLTLDEIQKLVDQVRHESSKDGNG